jgi:membrane peptidoglycan carboxypeptidase
VRISGRDASRRAKTRHRGRRVALVTLLVAACMVMAAMIAAAVVLAAVPGVGDAQARVAAILREHGGRSVGLPVPNRIAASVVAVEDRRFYAHHGVDLQSLARVVWAGLRGKGWANQGGSTITQQLAKRLYTGDRGGVWGTLEQVGLAIKLDWRYPKAQVLRMYLDSVYFGNGSWGVTQASEGYFGKPPAGLSWGEASLLAGLVQAPTAYDPKVHLAAAERRQRHVLDRLVAVGTLRRAQADAAGRRLAAEAGRLGFTTSAA